MNSKILYDRSLHEPSGGYLQKRHSEHLSPSNIPGTRVYPYPGTTQEPVRNSYHHSGSHSSSLPIHYNPLYNIGANSPHSAAVGPQAFREGNYAVDRHEFSSIDRYRNRAESNEIHHSGGAASASNAGNTGHNQPPLVRRRPSLLPHVSQNDYLLSSSGGLSQYVNRDRYDLYRYAPYDSRTKGNGLQTSSMTLPSTTASGHSGTSSIHMVGQHGLHLSVGHPHQSQAMVTSQHLSQPHIIQDIQDLNVNKRPRLGFTNDSRHLHQPLLIDTRDVVEVKKEPAYTPQVEAISPTLPNDDNRQDSPLKSTKDELLQNINKIDREISITESQISKLRKKHQEHLELVTNKPTADNQDPQENVGFESQLSIAQIIYSENKTKSMRAHTQLDKLGPAIELPLYNQPSDTLIYHENKQNFVSFKKNLIQFFKKRYQEKQLRERYLTDTYDKLMLSWLKKLEKKETNPTKKTKDLKTREYFEKQFPELRKQREDKERFSRVGQRIRSDAELEEIMDGLQEQELEDKKIRSYAVIPPILLDSRHITHKFINRNGIFEDPMAEYKERQMFNIWSDQEKEIFREKYLLHPKNFGLIASFLERKSVQECVQYYYLSKKNENYKQLLRKQVKKRTRALVKAQQQQQAIAAQAQQQQHQRPPPPVARQPAPEESQKPTAITTTAAVTTTTTLTATTTMTAVMSTTITTTSSVMNESVTSVGVTPVTDMKVEPNFNDNGLKCDNISDNEENNENIESTSDTNHQCSLCETNVESAKSRAVTPSNLNLYNIDIDKFRPGMRVCLMCHFKRVQRQCPIGPSCKTPPRKVKRLKSLPQQWFDMSAETRQLFATELKVPTDVRNACPRCVMRISRRIGLMTTSDQPLTNHNSKSSWTDNEIDKFKALLKEVGKDWKIMAAQIATKTDLECRDFYLKHKYSFNFHKILKEFYIESGKTGKTHDSESDDFWNDMSDGDSEETSSAEEGNDHGNSDTASASSPISKTIEEMETNLKPVVDKTNKMICPPSRHFQEDFTKLQDYKGLSASQTSLKSDYDSSATMSADEGQGNGDGDRDRLSSSPAVILPPRANSAMPVFPPSNNIYYQHQSVDKHVRPASHDAAFAVDMASKVSHTPSVMRASDSNIITSRQKVPPFLINPNAPSAPHLSNSSPHSHSHLANVNVSKEEPTCVRDLIYQAIEMSLQSPLKPMRVNSQQPVANEISKLDSTEEIASNSSPYSLSAVKRENIIDLTKGDNSNDNPSHISYKNEEIQRPEGLAMMASYTQHLTPSPSHGSQPYVMIEPDEYEVQDLSKKDRKVDAYRYSPSMKDKLTHRSEYPYGLIPSAHSLQNRSSNPMNETSLDAKDGYTVLKHSEAARHMSPNYIFNERLMAQDVRSRSSPSSRQPMNMNMNMNKMTKPSSVPPPPPLINSGKPNQTIQLSPKMFREKIPVSAPSGGSITQGTPGIQTPNSYPYVPNRAYEGLLRQIPSVIHKESGSITLGTPLMSGTNPSLDNRRKNDIIISDPNRRSLSPSLSHSYSPGFGQPVYKQKPPFHKESQLSTNQIMIDFNTSKQMLTRRGSSNSDKDGRSSTPIQLESRSVVADNKMPSQTRLTTTSNSYPNQPTVPITSVFHQPQILAPDSHMNQWTARNSPMGAQSPNYSRQNVIQHWNANTKQSVIQTAKSNSPRDYRTEAVSPVAHPVMRSSASPQIPISTSSLYSPSHDAFTTLVNAAAAQQSLAVPNLDRRTSSVPIRSNIKDKPNAEGLERSLMDIHGSHGRPVKFGDLDNKSDDKRKIVSLETDSKQYHPNRSALTDDYVYVLEHRRKQQEMEHMAELERQRYNRSASDLHNPLSQPSLRFTREPFSKEQFERELRQPMEPLRHLPEHSFRVKPEDAEAGHEPRMMSGSRPQTSELDNEASKLFSQSFQKDNPKANSGRGQFTAANLIDAIITHQINASTDSANGKVNNQTVVSGPAVSESSPPTSVASLFGRYPNNDKLAAHQYHNREEVVTIADSPDPDKSYPPNEKPPGLPNVSNASKVTLGDHIATIISKNYNNAESRAPVSGPVIQIDSRKSPNLYGMATPLEVRTSHAPVLEGIAAAAVSNASSEQNNPLNESPPHSSWKLRKALQQDKESKDSDERQIVRIVQNVSPKERPVYPLLPAKSNSPALSHYNVEPISPPTHSTETTSSISTPYTQMQTTWSPATGIHNVMVSRPFYNADSSEVSASARPQPIVTTSSQMTPAANRANQPQIGLSALDYVKNRIVEVMRTTVDDTSDESNKRPNNEIHSTQNEKHFKAENESKMAFNVNQNEMISGIDSTKRLNTSLKREVSKSPTTGDHYNDPKPSSTERDESESPAKKMRSNPVIDRPNDMRETNFQSTHESKTPVASHSLDTTSSETKVSPSFTKEVVKSDEKPETSNISSSDIDTKPNEVSEVSSGHSGQSGLTTTTTTTTSAPSLDPKDAYVDSPGSATSPGEMVIDESDHNLSSSLSPTDKTASDSPPTSSSHTTQQSLISTTEVHKNNSLMIASKSSAIGSSNEISSEAAVNQSQSVSSSQSELDKPTPTPVSDTSAPNESHPNYSKQTDRSDNSLNAANSVSSTASASVPSNPESTQDSAKSSPKASGVSSSIGNSCEERVAQTCSQSGSNANVQSSAVSGSGGPTSTTGAGGSGAANVETTPQYEPLSDDE